MESGFGGEKIFVAAIKEAGRIAALRDHRSVANLIEYLIRRHCQAAGIAIPEQPELFNDDGNE